MDLLTKALIVGSLTDTLELISTKVIPTAIMLNSFDGYLYNLPRSIEMYSSEALVALSKTFQFLLSNLANVAYQYDHLQGLFNVLYILSSSNSLSAASNVSVSSAKEIANSQNSSFRWEFSALSGLIATNMVVGQNPYVYIDYPMRYVFSHVPGTEEFSLCIPLLDIEIYKGLSASYVTFPSVKSHASVVFYPPKPTGVATSFLSDAIHVQVFFQSMFLMSLEIFVLFMRVCVFSIKH